MPSEPESGTRPPKNSAADGSEIASDLAAGDDSLAAALARHAIELPDSQSALLASYCQTLWEWNARLNLTRHTDYEKFVARDLCDVLQLAPLLQSGERLLDVGTGGGVPGIPLAIVRPDLNVTLIDSVAKKTRAVTEILDKLQLPVAVHTARVQEHLAAGARYDSLVIRAVARLEELLRWFGPHRAGLGRLLVFKGPAWVEERYIARQKRLLDGWQLRRVANYPLAGTHSESVILELQPLPDAPKTQPSNAPASRASKPKDGRVGGRVSRQPRQQP